MLGRPQDHLGLAIRCWVTRSWLLRPLTSVAAGTRPERAWRRSPLGHTWGMDHRIPAVTNGPLRNAKLPD
jgi:hypothetical protein